MSPPMPFPAGSIRCSNNGNMPVSHNGIMLVYLCGWGEEPESLDKCCKTGKNHRRRWKYRDRNMPVSILNSYPQQGIWLPLPFARSKG